MNLKEYKEKIDKVLEENPHFAELALVTVDDYGVWEIMGDFELKYKYLIQSKHGDYYSTGIEIPSFPHEDLQQVLEVY